MDNPPNQIAPRSAARLEFARRLRELRAIKGYRTARSLARALEIDENRYTRYERAEVEPDLELLLRICQALDVTPNELLSSDKLRAPAGSVPMSGPLAETGATFSGADDADRHAALHLQSIGWDLCVVVTDLRQAQEPLTAVPEAGAAPPLAILQVVSGLQQELDRQPFAFIRQIVRDPAVLDAPPDKAQKLKELIDRLTAAMARSADKRT